MTTLTRRLRSDRTAAHSPGTGVPHGTAWAYAAFWFTLLYIPIHAYWALGGAWGLPASVAPHGARDVSPATQSAMRVANGGVCVLLLIGAVIVLALASPWGRRVHPSLLLVPMWIGSVVCVSHGVYGFITKGLYVMGVHGAVEFPEVTGVSAATAAAKNHTSAVLDLVAFEPYFLMEGVLIALATRQFLRTPAARRRWTTTIIIGTLVIDAFGALLSAFHLHFAVS
jgi:hypothetical protein